MARGRKRSQAAIRNGKLERQHHGGSKRELHTHGLYVISQTHTVHFLTFLSACSSGYTTCRQQKQTSSRP